ncbi:hypothetical protein TRVL_05605 [Trypanosoma vivax]|nr:hypothetical protein TRVL_05605 [Trypanosoma vivax]
MRGLNVNRCDRPSIRRLGVTPGTFAVQSSRRVFYSRLRACGTSGRPLTKADRPLPTARTSLRVTRSPWNDPSELPPQRLAQSGSILTRGKTHLFFLDAHSVFLAEGDEGRAFPPAGAAKEMHGLPFSSATPYFNVSLTLHSTAGSRRCRMPIVQTNSRLRNLARGTSFPTFAKTDHGRGHEASSVQCTLHDRGTR